MLLERKEYFDEDQSLGYVESIFKSENILATIYFPKKNKLYVTFSRGNTYSYLNVNDNFYKRFEDSESQGKFLHENLLKEKQKYPYYKEYKLMDFEINNIKEKINKFEEDDEEI
jgi:hypothetical protein